MFTEQQEERLIAALKQVLKDKNLTINGLCDRYKLDRGVVTRMSNGKPPDLKVVEKFASRLRLDVNTWRELCGYDPVPDTACRASLNAADYFYERWSALEEENPDKVLMLPRRRSGFGTLTKERVDRIIERARQKIAEGKFDTRDVAEEE